MTVRSPAPRLLAAAVPGRTTDAAHHRAVHGPLPELGPSDADALIAAVDAAGLRGRGGAGFPTARKLEAVHGRRHAVVVVNGTEGEPASGKDRLLLAGQPHLVLDGAEVAAHAVGARELVIVAPADTLPVLARAQDERAAPRDLAVRLVAAADGYVAGEETAVLAHVEGRPARPRVSPPRPAEHGLHGRPTLVQNVETLAHLTLIARYGPQWFRQQGTAERPGTMLATVSGAVRRPAVHEVAVGTSLRDLLARAGGPDEPLRAVLVGGYFGAWIDARADPALSDTTLDAHGAAVGAGVGWALAARGCPVAATARIAVWMAGESAGQCGSCVHGLGALGDLLARMADGRGTPGDVARLRRWTAMVDRRGACAHPSGVARLLRSAVSVFAEELADHERHGACRACAAERTATARRAVAA